MAMGVDYRLGSLKVGEMVGVGFRLPIVCPCRRFAAYHE